uniref:Uncharacterized protein n=1 Tax=Arion vulgaris TaxID=1028688 RepID=A0A0B7ABZ4_9EUPU
MNTVNLSWHASESCGLLLVVMNYSSTLIKSCLNKICMDMCRHDDCDSVPSSSRCNSYTLLDDALLSVTHYHHHLPLCLR